jgi:glycosyltransferase involved in cell wall biosynthesis
MRKDVMSAQVDLSVIVPCFNEEEGLLEFHRRMTASCAESGAARYEIIYVNDGSSDGTLKTMLDLQRKDRFVSVIDLARNHGHQIALSAGLAHARGKCVLTIDADLQDPPELLPVMMHKMKEGADVVYAQRHQRWGESMFKRMTAFVFYRLIARIGSTRIPVDTGDFRLMRREVVDVLINMPRYAVPLVPLSAMIIGVGLDEALEWMMTRGRWFRTIINDTLVPFCVFASFGAIAQNARFVMLRQASLLGDERNLTSMFLREPVVQQGSPQKFVVIQQSFVPRSFYVAPTLFYVNALRAAGRSIEILPPSVISPVGFSTARIPVGFNAAVMCGAVSRNATTVQVTLKPMLVEGECAIYELQPNDINIFNVN